MSQNEKLRPLSEFEQEEFRLADIQAAHREKLMSEEYGPSMAAKASAVAAAHRKSVIESMGDMAEHMLDPMDKRDEPWQPEDPGTTVTLARLLEKPLDGTRLVPAVRFQREMTAEELVENDSFKGHPVFPPDAPHGGMVYQVVPMAEAKEDGSLDPLGEFTDADVMEGASMLQELQDARRDPEELPHLAEDLATLVHPGLLKLIMQSNIPDQG